MNKIDEMIKEYCPNGVEFRELNRIVNITTGKLNANAMEKNGKYPFFTCNAEPFKINTYTFDLEAILISGNGSQVGHINYYNGKFNAYQRTYILYNFKKIIIIKYFFYYLKTYLKEYILKNCKSGSIPYITLPMLKYFPIPIPPLPIQQQIVNILDKFTELEAELEAELEVRKKQYEYYRDRLLEFREGEGGVEWRELGEVCDIKIGGDIPKNSTKGQLIPNKECPYPIFSNGVELYGYTSTYKIDKDAVTVSSIGNVGYVAYRKAYFTPIIRLKVLIPKNNNIMVKYLYYSLTKVKFIGTNSSLSSINANSIKKIKIPIPSLEKQQQIVSILDKFDTLVNDIKEGLPKEIELRKKQYEYYRDKLLTFKNINEEENE